MSDGLYERVADIFQKILTPQQFEAIHPTAAMDDIDGWDSMNFLEVIMGLEAEFGIRIDGLDAAGMVSIDNILTYLRSET